jgi:hypothetical protein
MFWKRITNDLHLDQRSRTRDIPLRGNVGITELSSNVGAVGWIFNGMNR